MIEATIQRGEVVTVKAYWIDSPCPFCRTLVRAGEKHSCSLAPVPQPQTHEASK